VNKNQPLRIWTLAVLLLAGAVVYCSARSGKESLDSFLSRYSEENFRHVRIIVVWKGSQFSMAPGWLISVGEPLGSARLGEAVVSSDQMRDILKILIDAAPKYPPFKEVYSLQVSTDSKNKFYETRMEPEKLWVFLKTAAKRIEPDNPEAANVLWRQE
jgi:hypothetical protein